MDSLQLKVTDREERGTAASRRMRKTGFIPVNLYGLGREPRHMTASQHEAQMMVDKGYHIVELLQDDNRQVVLIQDVQFDALGTTVLHADFLRIDSDKPVNVFVPVRFIGLAPEVSGSVVDKPLEDIGVECLPLGIPDEFVINLSKLDVGDAFRIGDLEMPANCKVHGHLDTDVIVVNHIKVEKAEVEDEDGGVEPEVIGKPAEDTE